VFGYSGETGQIFKLKYPYSKFPIMYVMYWNKTITEFEFGTCQGRTTDGRGSELRLNHVFEHRQKNRWLDLRFAFFTFFHIEDRYRILFNNDPFRILDESLVDIFDHDRGVSSGRGHSLYFPVFVSLVFRGFFVFRRR